MKLPQKIVAIDLETTDSDYHVGEIIQIGAIVVNTDLSLGKSYESLIRPTTSHRNPEAMAVNKISEDSMMISRYPNAVLKEFAEFCKEETVEDRPLLGAWGAYFDIVFLKESFYKYGIEYPFSYRCVDLKSIAIWEMAKRDDSASGGVYRFLEKLGLSFEGTQHDALADIKNTMRIIQKLR